MSLCVRLLFSCALCLTAAAQPSPPAPTVAPAAPAAPARTAAPANASAASAPPVFIAPDGLEVSAFVPPPPTDDSPAGRADLETVLRVQADLTPAQESRALRVAGQTVFTFGQPVLGAWFTAENLPRTAEWFKVITAEGYAVTLQGKRFWTRDRPYLRDPRIRPIPRASRSPSYPSGHSSDAATWAVILEAAFPELTGGFEEQVHEAMWGRVLAGSHYPSDTQAGKTLGQAIGRAMLKSPAMPAALAEIRAEITAFRAAQKTPPPS